MDVASVGHLNFDIYLKTSELPELDESVEALDLYTGGGGSGANFAVAAARLGVRVKFIGAVGGDPLGELSLRELRQEGVDVTHVKRIPTLKSGVVVVLVHPDGGKRMVSYRGANLGLSPADLTPEKFAPVRHIHIATGRLELITRGKEIARELGASTSIAGGAALAKKGLEVAKAAAAGADVFFLNYAEARALQLQGLDAVEKLYRELAVGELVVTLGSRGAVVHDGGRLLHLDAFRVNAVDTTGAGDVFAAGYIAMRLRGLGLYERLLFANAAAAIKVTRAGARSSPRFEEVVAFLEGYGYKI